MKRNSRITFVMMLGLLQLAVACTNINQKVSGLNTALTGTATVLQSSTAYSHTLKNFTFETATATGGTTPPLTLTLTTDTSAGTYQPLTGFCGLSTNPCACEMVWTQASTVNGTAYNYERTRRVSVVEVQSGLVKCSLPQTAGDNIWSEIADGTVIHFRIIPVSTNSTGLNTTTLNWKKGTSVSASGDFLDDTLTPFRNVHRYTCFSKNKDPRAHELVNRFSPATTSTGAAIPIIMGSKYCSGTAASGTSSGTTSDSTECPAPRNGFTAQSYYRNFFIRSDKLGEINSTNDTYDCPKVLESIKYSAGQTIPAAETGKYWPLDTTFALATTTSSEWSVGVPAATNLFKSGDANSTQTLCSDEPNENKRLKDGKTVVKCLGYAKKPNTNGSCGTIKDSNGRVRPLTRLRRYRVVYPPTFDSNGKVQSGNPFSDEVYVADRLVVDSTGTTTGAMIYGPKPCNYSWFDHEGVTTRDGSVNFFSNLNGDGGAMYATPGYVATSDYQYISNHSNPGGPGYNDYHWSVDPDGLVIPNSDHNGSTTNAQNYSSCSVSLPWVDWSNGSPSDLRLITTNNKRLDKVTLGGRDIYLREIHNQPVDPWTPSYVEDTSFNACVPLPSEFVEAPLQIYQKDSNTMGWCAKVYPTQNPYWYDLNRFRKPQSGSADITANLATYPASAPVKIYTSHDRTLPDPLDNDGLNNNCTGTRGTTVCTMTGFTSGAPLTGCSTYLSRANNTCDRTVMYDSNQQYLGFPLLAKDTDINKMLSDDLSHDKSFGCEYSVNTDASKIGTKIPSSGCCGYVGSTPHKLLRNLTNGTGAHLEPYKDPSATADIRFCGWPVE